MTALGIVLTALALAPAAGDDSAAALEKRGVKFGRAGGTVVTAQAKVDDFTAADYKLLGQCTGLKKLSLSGKTITDDNLALLTSLTKLEEFVTNGSSLTDAGYKHFTAFTELITLTMFHPSWEGKSFTGRGLAELRVLPKLERLTFAGSTTGDEAMEAVGQLTQLKEFRTWHTSQTQSGNVHLLKLPKLTALKLGQRLPRKGSSAPSFDESTVPLIARIKTLEKLDLGEARLSAAGLMPLKELPNLKQLMIQNSDISSEDVDRLRRELPKVKIGFKPLSDAEREALLTKKLKL